MYAEQDRGASEGADEIPVANVSPDPSRHGEFTMIDSETGQTVWVPDIGRLGSGDDGRPVAEAFVYENDPERGSAHLVGIHEVVLPERLGFGRNVLNFTKRHKEELGLAAIGLVVVIGASKPLRVRYRNRHAKG